MFPVNRPLVALGLVAAALTLLTVLVADMQQAVEEPSLELSEEGAEAAAKAAEKLGPGAAETLGSNADSITLPDGATVTLPEGTEIDGDLIKLAQALAWTLPGGTELENLSLELPPGVGFEIPDGTWADGDTLVFPPGSELRLDDGTVLQLPDGGRLTMPGASSGEMARMLDAGHAFTREGSTFSAPRVISDGDWPVMFPAGTEFQMPDGMELPEGTLPSDMDVQFPPGSELQTTSANADAGSGGSLFDKIGNLDFSGKEPAGSNEGSGGGFSGLAGLPGIPGGAWWLWTLLAVALLVGAWFLWRYRDRLRGAIGSATGTGSMRDAPLRLHHRIDDRPGDLPLALAPGTTGTLHLTVQARQRAPPQTESESADVAPARPTPRWVPTSAELRLAIDGTDWTNRMVDVTGTNVTIPDLTPGTHTISATVTSPDARGTFTLRDEIHVAPWNEQVARDYQRLYDRAVTTLELPDGVTPRVLAAAVRARAEPEDDPRLDELIGTFETANYGHREVDQDGWIRFAGSVNHFVALLDAIDATRPPRSRRMHADPATASASGADATPA